MKNLTENAKVNGCTLTADLSIDDFEKYCEITDAKLIESDDNYVAWEVSKGSIYREFDGVGNVEFQAEFDGRKWEKSI